MSACVKELLRLDGKEQLKVIGAGVKVLERQDSKVGGWLGGQGRNWVNPN